MTDWQRFQETITWADLLGQYTDALSHVEIYKQQNPEGMIPRHALAAVVGLTSLYQGTIRPIVGNKAMLTKTAPPDAVHTILRAVGAVRTNVKVYLHGGHA